MTTTPKRPRQGQRLRLKAERVRELAPEQLGEAAGGLPRLTAQCSQHLTLGGGG